MPSTRWYAPPEQLPRSRQDLVRTSGQLMTIDPPDVGAINCVLLEAATVNEADEDSAEIRFVFLLKRKGETITCRGPRLQLQ